MTYYPQGGNTLTVAGADSLGAIVALTVPVDSLITTVFFDLASAISAGVASGITKPFHDAAGSTIPLVTAGVGALYTGAIDATAATIAGPSRVALPGGYDAFVDNSSRFEFVTGVGDTNPPVSIISGIGGLGFTSGTGYDGGIGFGTVVAGGAPSGNQVTLSASTVSTGGFLISLGAGDIPGLAAGPNFIFAASGTNTILGAPVSDSDPSLINPTYGLDHLYVDLTPGSAPGDVSSTDFIDLTGDDTVTANSGDSHVTISVEGGGTDVLAEFQAGWTGTLWFADLGDADARARLDLISGGSGSVTVFGGLASTVVQGGAAGRNLIVAGTSFAQLIGGGDGDLLYASSLGGGALGAGPGAESLIGTGHDPSTTGVANRNPAGATVAGTLFAGSGAAGARSFIYAGTGADTIEFGAAAQFVDGNVGRGGTAYVFDSAQTSILGGAAIEIRDFTVGADAMVFTGYNETMAQIAAAATIFGGNTAFRLNDGTNVTVDNVTTLFNDGRARFLATGSTPVLNGLDSGGVASTLTGAADQTLLASSLGGGVLAAAGGNETLIGASHNPLNTGVSNPYQVGATVGGTVFDAATVAGAVTDIYVGPGTDTVNFGAGAQYVDGNVGLGGTLYVFSNTLTSLGGGARIELQDFTVGRDTIVASGYGESAAEMASGATIAGGNTVFTLTDGTMITVDNVTTLFNDPNTKLAIS